ncbi:hypothetical protein ABLG96_15630 [Nakamurella sp. A5-74]|uniref:Glycosyltransferase RgtA/B/C/D-like domain-containing protein n=1 Tax=Nakamurella sp. A5-74 TaxID=3158264 RepID=A0AAU8DN54_9ACTN
MAAFILLAAFTSLFKSLQYTAIGSPLVEVDETSSASYAAALARWVSPTITTRTAHGTSGFPGVWLAQVALPVQQMIWTANHPPLYHLLAVPAVWIADWTGTPGLALFTMRFISAASTALVVLISGHLALELLPRRPVVALVSASATAAMTTIVFQGGFAYNDGFATATGGLALLVLARAARRGVTAGRVGWITVWCTASAGTRPTGVVLTAVVVVAVLLICLVQGRSRGQAIRFALVVGTVPALLVGWFYLRNIILFGDATASNALLQRFGRKPNPRLTTIDGSLIYLRSQWDQLFTQRRLKPSSSSWVHFIRVVGKVLAAGFAVLVVSSWIRDRRLFSVRSRPIRWWSTAILWATLVAVSVATIVATIAGLAAGVGSHERYLMPVEPLLTIALGLGVAGLASWIPWARARAIAVTIAAAMGAGLFVVFGVLTQRVTVDWFTRFQIARGKPPLLGLGTAEVFGAVATLAAVLGLLICIALVVTAVATNPRSSPPGADGRSRPKAEEAGTATEDDEAKHNAGA